MPVRETIAPNVLEQWKGVNQRLQPTLVPDGFFSFAKGIYFGLGENATRLSGKLLAGKISSPILGITVLNKIALLQTNTSLLSIPLAELLDYDVAPAPPSTFALVSKVIAFDDVTFNTGAIDTTGADLLVANVTFYNTLGADPVITDSNGNTWIPLTVRSSGDISTRLVYCVPTTVGVGHTFTATFGAVGYATLSVVAYSGAHASPFDQESGAGTTGTSVQPGSLTPSVDGCLVVCGFINRDTGATPATCSIAIQEVTPFGSGVNFAGGIACDVQSLASATNPQWSWASSWAAASGLAIFKPA